LAEAVQGRERLTFNVFSVNERSMAAEVGTLRQRNATWPWPKAHRGLTANWHQHRGFVDYFLLSAVVYANDSKVKYGRVRETLARQGWCTRGAPEAEGALSRRRHLWTGHHRHHARRLGGKPGGTICSALAGPAETIAGVDVFGQCQMNKQMLLLALDLLALSDGSLKPA
jgi:hypothetical protein